MRMRMRTHPSRPPSRPPSAPLQLEDIDFGRRMAVERELAAAETAPAPNAVFDESGHFLLYPCLLGVKVVNLETNKVARILGERESRGERGWMGGGGG